MLPWATRKLKNRRIPRPLWLGQPANPIRAVNDTPGPAEKAVPPTNRREQGGRWEQHAERWLVQRGLIAVHRQWHGRWGELDLIMADGATAVVVEVRQRTRADYGGALHSIDRIKRRRIVRTARYWWLTEGRLKFSNLRFDVVVFEGTNPPHWLVAAFDQEGSV